MSQESTPAEVPETPEEETKIPEELELLYY
jgi:hypothetical protein